MPPPLHHADRLLLTTQEVGCPISIDMETLEHPDAPVRMSFGCRKDDLLPEFITLFVNMQGYHVKVIRETPSVDDLPPQAPPRFPPGDGNDDKEEECEETDDDRWDGRRGRHIQKNKRSSASAPGSVGGGPRKSVPLGTSPCSPSAYHPPADASLSLHIPTSAYSQYGTNLTTTGNIFSSGGKDYQGNCADSY
jgi:hypothetical protein